MAQCDVCYIVDYIPERTRTPVGLDEDDDIVPWQHRVVSKAEMATVGGLTVRTAAKKVGVTQEAMLAAVKHYSKE